MIPVMMRFWLPHGGGEEPPPGDDPTCEDTYGEDFVTLYYDTFGTDGNLDGASPAVSPGSDWTYSDTSAVRSGGSVSPATFSASGTQAAFYKALVSVNIASGETLTMIFDGAGYTIQVVLALGSGEACSYSIIWPAGGGDEGETVADTFSIGTSPGEVTIGIDCSQTYNELEDRQEMYLYLSPNLVSSPVATLVAGANSFPTYTQCDSFEFACTGSNTAVNFIRVCADTSE